MANFVNFFFVNSHSLTIHFALFFPFFSLVIILLRFTVDLKFCWLLEVFPFASQAKNLFGGSGGGAQ